MAVTFKYHFITEFMYVYIRPPQIWNHFSKQTSHLKAADNNYCYNSYAVLKKQ